MGQARQGRVLLEKEQCLIKGTGLWVGVLYLGTMGNLAQLEPRCGEGVGGAWRPLGTPALQATGNP